MGKREFGRRRWLTASGLARNFDFPKFLKFNFEQFLIAISQFLTLFVAVLAMLVHFLREITSTVFQTNFDFFIVFISPAPVNDTQIVCSILPLTFCSRLLRPIPRSRIARIANRLITRQRSCSVRITPKFPLVAGGKRDSQQIFTFSRPLFPVLMRDRLILFFRKIISRN